MQSQPFGTVNATNDHLLRNSFFKLQNFAITTKPDISRWSLNKECNPTNTSVQKQILFLRKERNVHIMYYTQIKTAKNVLVRYAYLQYTPYS